MHTTIEIELTLRLIPGERQTWTYPGSDPDIEIRHVEVLGMGSAMTDVGVAAWTLAEAWLAANKAELIADEAARIERAEAAAHDAYIERLVDQWRNNG